LLDYGWSSLHGLRRLQDKFISAPAPEYYRIRKDRGERENLYGRAPEAEELSRRLAERMSRWPSPQEILGQERALDPEERERLASLGYVRGAERPERLGVKDPKTMMGVWRRMRDAGRLSLEGDDEAAMREIEDVLRDDPTSGKAWYTAAEVYERAGDLARAETSVRRALDLSPRVEGWLLLAKLSLNRGDRATFDDALSRGPHARAQIATLRAAHGRDGAGR
jgi:tetratricopeptide (TPR) repeat protein